MDYHLSKVPQLNSCCCGCTLEKGAKIIGFTEAIICGILFVIGFIATIFVATGWNKHHEDYHYLYYADSVSILLLVDVSYLFKTCFSTFLLIGIYKKKPFYIKTWVIVETIFLLMSLVMIAVFTILLMFGLFHPELIEELISVGIQSYFILVVYSYYRDVRPGNFVNVE